MARTRGSKNKSESHMKKILREFAENNAEDIIYDVMSSGSASDKVRLLALVLDRVQPRLSSIEVTEDEAAKERRNLTELFLNEKTNERTY